MAGTACGPRSHGRGNPAEPGALAAHRGCDQNRADRRPALRTRRAAWRHTVARHQVLAHRRHRRHSRRAAVCGDHDRRVDNIASPSPRPDCTGAEQTRLRRRAGERRDQRGRRHRQRIFEWPRRACSATPDRGSCRPHAAGLDAVGSRRWPEIDRPHRSVAHAAAEIWSRCRKLCKISCSRSRWSPKAAHPSDDRQAQSCSRATRHGRCRGFRSVPPG